MDEELFCPIIYKSCYKIEGLTIEEEHKVCESCKKYIDFEYDVDKGRYNK